MDKQVIITIGREYGSGGHVIAQDIAKRFNVPYYNRNLIEEVAKQNNFDTDNIKDYDESPRKYLFSRTVQGIQQFSGRDSCRSSVRFYKKKRQHPENPL